jgi:hypothetical protein
VTILYPKEALQHAVRFFPPTETEVVLIGDFNGGRGDRRGPWEEARTPDVQYKIAAFCRRVERTIRNSISPPLMYYNCTICTIHAHTACRSYTEQYRTNSKRSTATKSGSPNTQPHSLSIIKLYPQSASASHEIHEKESGFGQTPSRSTGTVEVSGVRSFAQLGFCALWWVPWLWLRTLTRLAFSKVVITKVPIPVLQHLTEETVGHSPRDGLRFGHLDTAFASLGPK